MASNPNNYSATQSVLTNMDKDSASNSYARNNTLQSLYSEQIKIKMSLSKKKKAQETIFSKLCPRSEFKDTDTCAVCHKKFGINLFKVKKHCKFCGSCICDEHGQKRRADPENKKNFFRICDVCEMKYLYKMLNQDFNDQKKKLDQEMKDLQWQNDTVVLEVQKNQNLLDELKFEKEGKDKDFTRKVTSLSNEISKMEETIRKYEKEIINVTKNTKTCESEIIQAQELHEKLLKEQEILKNEELETTEKINAIQQDIQQTEQLIDEIDKKMAEMNVRKKLISDPSQNSYYSEENSLMEEDKKNDRDSGSVYSKRDGESLLNANNIRELNSKNEKDKNSVYQENNEIMEQIKKKKGGVQDENVKKMDKSCDVCRIM